MADEQYTKQVIDWLKVRAEVNARLGADYSVNYLQNVWRGNLKSGKVMEVLQELVPDDPELRSGASE